MAATIIDSLLVTLGLDPRPYKKQQTQFESDQRKFRDGTKKNANEISDALRNVGLEAAKLFIGFTSVKDGIKYLAGLNVATATLGRFSTNLGQSAHEVNTWGSAVELAGGSAQNAQADLMGLSASITALKATGEVSPLVLLLQRMGVALFDAQGKTRKLTDIYKDLGDKLKQFNRADAFNIAKGAGISEDTLNLILQAQAERQRLLDLAEKNNNVDEEAVKNAEKLQEEWREIGQSSKAFGMTILEAVTPAVKALFETSTKLFDTFKETGALSAVGKIFTGIWDLTKLVVSGWKELLGLFKGGVLEKYFSWLGNFYKETFKFGDAMLDQVHELANPQGDAKAAATPAKKPTAQESITEAAKKYGIPEDVLRNLIKTESGFDPKAFNKQSGATGIAQLLPKYHPNAGKDANADIDEAGKTLLEYYKQFGSWELAAAAYNTGPGNLKKEIAGAKAIPKETRNYVGKIFGSNNNALDAARFAASGSAPSNGTMARNGGTPSTTTVQIDSININAPNAQDAGDIASELPGALKRKGVVAQADTTMS